MRIKGVLAVSVLAVALMAQLGCWLRPVEVKQGPPVVVTESVPAAAAAVAEKAAKFTIAQENLQIPNEMKTCATNFAKINTALAAYKLDKGKMPDWLSDLVPQYLSAEALACPNDPDHTAPYFPDPKLPCSYGFEFSPTSYGGDAGPLSNKTAAEWKTAQMKLFGNVVPVVRCHHHGQQSCLNLSCGGQVYVSPLSWEVLFIPNYQSGQEFQAAK